MTSTRKGEASSSRSIRSFRVPALIRALLPFIAAATSAHITLPVPGAIGDVPEAGTDTALVAFYPLNGSGVDVTANRNSGVLRGFRPVADRRGSHGGAVEFTGRRDSLLLPASSDFSFASTEQLTISFWVRLPADRPAARISFRSGDGGLLCRYFAFHLNVSGEAVDATVHASECRLLVRAGFPPGTTRWHHVACTVDNDFLVLFLDGRRASVRGVYDMKWEAPMINGACIAADTPVSPHEFALDDLRIYRRRLNEVEIARQAAGEEGNAETRP